MACRSRRVGSGFGRCSSLRGRPRLRGGGGLSGAGGSSLPSLAFIWTGFSRASPRTAIRGAVASRAIAPMVRPPSARSISAAWILSGSSPRANSANARENVASEGTCERRSKAEDAAQGLVDVEALDQGAGGGNAQDRLGHESSGEGAAVLGRPARPPGRLVTTLDVIGLEAFVPEAAQGAGPAARGPSRPRPSFRGQGSPGRSHHQRPDRAPRRRQVPASHPRLGATLASSFRSHVFPGVRRIRAARCQTRSTPR